MRTTLLAACILFTALSIQMVSTCEAVEEKDAMISTAGPVKLGSEARVMPSVEFEITSPDERRAQATKQVSPNTLPHLKLVGDQVTRKLQDKVDAQARRMVRQMAERLPK